VDADAKLLGALLAEMPFDLDAVVHGEFVHGGVFLAVVALHGKS
jgi:hypothetical protein